MKYNLILFITTLLVNAAYTKNTNDTIDLTKYMGKWYQIADYPQFYEYFTCYECTTATYELLSNESISVLNQASGKNNCAVKGVAHVVDEKDVSKLAVRFDFFPFFFPSAQYWIYRVGELNEKDQYSWSIVSNEKKDTCYVLSRTPTVDDTFYDRLLGNLTSLGFDINRLKKTKQYNCGW